jgi:alpha-tubulin suppressor-like RCC1 family protein
MVQSVSSTNHSCAILDDSGVKCWGSQSSGKSGPPALTSGYLGDAAGEMGASLPKIDLGTNHFARKVVTGWNSTCVLREDYQVVCFGRNSDGQLGIGNTSDIDASGEFGDSLSSIDFGSNRFAIDLVGGNSAHCAILDDGGVRCWGKNDTGAGRGKLGQDNTLNVGDGTVAVSAISAIYVGAGVSVMGLSSGSHHFCAALDTGGVRCWGDNAQGQLGTGNISDIGFNTGSNSMTAISDIDLGTGESTLALSQGMGAHSCAILGNRDLKCWGENDSGELGLGTTDNQGDGSSEMGDDLDAIDLDGNKVLQAVNSSVNTCALTADGTVRCWGYGAAGINGNESADDIGDGAGEMGSSLSAIDLGAGEYVTSITGSANVICAQLSSGKVKCWGQERLLGIGSGGGNIGDGADEMGDDLPEVILW